jgi:NAD(P)H-hydrate epimerase
MGMLGAGALASRAALRGGAGLVTWVVPQSLAIPASSLATEAMICPVPDEGGRLTLVSEKAVRDALKGRTAAVFGPGMSRNPDTVELIRNILHTIDIPMVLDADGLFAVSGYPALLSGAEHVLTPHPGEMARLMGCSVADIECDRMGAVQRCAERYGGTAVLKGATTLVASGGELAINLTGNPGMATGGSGDVLAGLTGALLAQGVPPFEAAARACWLHGRAGDIAAKEYGEAGLAAGDIVECLPMASGGDGLE